jgi:hypothetical protein
MATANEIAGSAWPAWVRASEVMAMIIDMLPCRAKLVMHATRWG